MKETMAAVKGTIAYRERIALPADAVVTVKLQDVSLQDVAAKVISEQTFTTDGAQVPFDFELSYDTKDINPKHTYSVSARIEVAGSCALSQIPLTQLSRMQTKQSRLTFC